MKNNLFKLIALFIAFLMTVFATVILLCLNLELTVKIIVGVIGLILSIVEYVCIKNINQGHAVIVTHDDVEEVPQQFSSKHILCPKCYKPFDGKICFYCGFEKEENN